MTTSVPLSRWTLTGDSGVFPNCPQEARTVGNKVQALLAPDPEHRPRIDKTMPARNHPVGPGDGELLVGHAKVARWPGACR
jgi:hypothetical protein